MIRLIIGAGLLLATVHFDQTRDEAQSTRQPGLPGPEIRFTEVWVWEYTSLDGSKGEMAVYREPKRDYWLLTAEAFGNTDEMTDWFLLRPDGKVLQAYRDPEQAGRKKLVQWQMQYIPSAQIPINWKRGAKSRVFGNANLGFPIFKAREYTANYTATQEQSVYYIADTRADCRALYEFNACNIDARLPVHFPSGIPGHKIVLSEHTILATGSLSYRFRYISHTVYDINLADYELTH